MARATGIGSMFWGKLGNVVGYLTKNRAGRYVQSVKAYQPIVANPQSVAQALARIPLGPVQRFFSQLSNLIQRGFEGVSYGDASKSEFLSYNLANFKGPYLVKSELKPIPGPFLVAKGSLVAPPVIEFTTYGGDNVVVFDLLCANSQPLTTIRRLSYALLNNNAWLMAGEQMTLIACVLVNGEYHYVTRSFYLDVTDETVIDWIYTREISGDVYLGWRDSGLFAMGDMLAACLVRSQPYGDTGFRRSTSFLTLNPAFTQYQTEEALVAAVNSYRDAADGDDDWPVDPTPEYQQIANICLISVTEDMVEDWDATAYAGVQCMGYVTKGGEFGIFYVIDSTTGDPVLIKGDASYLYVTIGSTRSKAFMNVSYQPSVLYLNSYGTIY